MKRTTLALAAILTLGTAAVGTTGAANAKDPAVTATTTATTNAAGVQLAAAYRYYRIVPRHFVRIQLQRRGYYRIHGIRLVRQHVRPYGPYNGYRPYARAFYVAYAYKFGQKFRIFVNAYNGQPYRRVRVY